MCKTNKKNKCPSTFYCTCRAAAPTVRRRLPPRRRFVKNHCPAKHGTPRHLSRTSEVAGRALNVRFCPLFPKRRARRLRSHGAGRARVIAAGPHADYRPRPHFHPRAHLSLSPRGARHKALATWAVRWGAMGRGGARWGGCARAHRFTARPPQTMRPSGHASTRLVARHTCQHYDCSCVHSAITANTVASYYIIKFHDAILHARPCPVAHRKKLKYFARFFFRQKCDYTRVSFRSANMNATAQKRSYY